MSLRNYLIGGAAALGMALPATAGAQQLGVTTSDLNLRTQPGGQVITSMPRGSQVHIHQCPGSWCQVSYGNVTGWASQRYLSTGVAMQPRTRTYSAARPSVSFGVEVGPRYHYRDHGPRRYGSRFHRWSPGWYDDHYFDGRRWYYDGAWYDRPRASFSFSFGR